MLVTYADTQTRHGAPLVVRSYENGLNAVIYVGGESIGSVDRGSWEGHRVLMWARRYPESFATVPDAVAFVLRELGAPDGQ